MLLDQGKSCLLLVDIQEKLTPFIQDAEAVVARCAWLLQLARQREVPILVSEQYPAGLGHTVKALDLHPENEVPLEKIYFSSMREVPFVQRLQKMRKSHVVLAGIESHVCILQTALEMKLAALEVFVVVDAIGSRHALDHQYALQRMAQAGIHLVTAEMVFFEWLRHADSPEFKSLSKTFLQKKEQK